MLFSVVFYFSSRRRHTRFSLVSWARRCAYETATLTYLAEDGEIWFPDGEECFGTDAEYNYSAHGCGFGVNATNGTKVTFDLGGAPISEEGGQFHLFYQKRVIDASGWISEPINDSIIENSHSRNVALTSPSVFLRIACIFLAALAKSDVRVKEL